ncbi:MAG: hypothetical protein DWI26_03845 [Planctomycetota bacterium]|nr:MAG: hypothetical protein DWI26_03845 [Planctomycetota bacterium]
MSDWIGLHRSFGLNRLGGLPTDYPPINGPGSRKRKIGCGKLVSCRKLAKCVEPGSRKSICPNNCRRLAAKLQTTGKNSHFGHL